MSKTYGFRAYNDFNQVLISSELENFHYGGQAGYIGVKSQYANYGGHMIHTYRYGTGGTPIVFIKPSNYSEFYAVLTHRHIPELGYWEFDVVHSGTVDVHPDIHVFISPKDLNRPTEDYGMQVYLPDGTVSFDSRLSPLSIVGGGVCRPPSCAPNDGCTPDSERSTDWNYNELDWDFHCDQSYRPYLLNGLNPNNLMFASPSLAQSAWVRKYYGYKYSNGGGCGEDGQAHYSWVSWGCFYRNAFRITSSSFDAGWVPMLDSYYFSSKDDDGGWSGGGGGSTTAGTPLPFTQKTINLVNNAYLLADVTTYA